MRVLRGNIEPDPTTRGSAISEEQRNSLLAKRSPVRAIRWPMARFEEPEPRYPMA